jgi:hypothetical protein
MSKVYAVVDSNLEYNDEYYSVSGSDLAHKNLYKTADEARDVAIKRLHKNYGNMTLNDFEWFDNMTGINEYAESLGDRPGRDIWDISKDVRESSVSDLIFFLKEKYPSNWPNYIPELVSVVELELFD